ncbi:MAG: DUF2279 domain-containing protein [Bacteroidetes bacterium]|nr:DUF2279 domain-containing protein [Bacteroidota bacterium]
MSRIALLLFTVLFLNFFAGAQDVEFPRCGGDVYARPENHIDTFFNPSKTFNKKRAIGIFSFELAGGGGSLIALQNVWYKDYPREKFHYFNDNAEWMGMDKCGHITASYEIGRYCTDLYYWSGMNFRNSTLLGGLTGFTYQGVLEIFDGYSSGWGFSWGDMAANAGGYFLYAGQNIFLKKQFITPKFSFSKSGYAQYRPSLLGENFSSQLFKDYNGQIYWASVNISSFIPGENRFPSWLNIAFGYGANGMTGARTNPPYYSANGNLLTFQRYQQFYISPDIDLSKIRTHSHFLHTVFVAVGFLKIPAPGMIFENGKVKCQWIAH